MMSHSPGRIPYKYRKILEMLVKLIKLRPPPFQFYIKSDVFSFGMMVIEVHSRRPDIVLFGTTFSVLWGSFSSFSTPPVLGYFAVSNPHFLFYGVVSVIRWVIPYKYRKILEMVLNLMDLCEPNGAQVLADGALPWPVKPCAPFGQTQILNLDLSRAPYCHVLFCLRPLRPRDDHYLGCMSSPSTTTGWPLFRLYVFALYDHGTTVV